MRIWGLTGGIASGKSAVAALLREHAVAVVDADATYHRLLAPDHGRPSALARTVAEAFGADLLDDAGRLDRRRLGGQVFADPAQRRRLEAIAHPAVAAAAAAAFADLAAQGHPVAVYDVPLLYERGLAERFAAVVVVWVPALVQRVRLMRRDNIDQGQAAARLAAQMSLDDKRRRADLVIDNSHGRDFTAAQVAVLAAQLRAVTAS